MIEMVVDSIRVSLMNYQRVVMLKEKMTDRYLPIWIGPTEADAIAVRLQGVSVPRPMTHDLLGSVIKNMGGELERVVINDLNNHTFYAKLYIKSASGEIVIDSRPSDALALSAGLGVPVFVDEQVFEKMQQ